MSEVDEMARAFGEYVRAERKLANISQRELARISGVSDSYLSQMERGLYRPSPEIIKSIAKAFNVPASTLYALFGWFDDDDDQGKAAETGVEEAIHRDSQLSVEHKKALLLMYKSFVGGS